MVRELRNRHVVVLMILVLTCSAAHCSLAAAIEPSQLRPETYQLRADSTLSSWRLPHKGWSVASKVLLADGQDEGLESVEGGGVLLSNGSPDAADLCSHKEFQDIDLRLEFCIPRKSNSGIKLNGLYEIQITDSCEVDYPGGGDCGGVYPRAAGPPHHFIDEGVPPRINAARPAGQWQVLEIIFKSPRFDTDGVKTANASLVKVVLNGQLIHEDVELRWPTGGAWNLLPEVEKGPLMLQGDHGPVAFRNITVREMQDD